MSNAPTPSDDAPAGSGGPRALPSRLDAQALQRLCELDPKGEARLLDRVFQAFETSVARLMPQLQASRRGVDHAGIRHVAHTLKSSSASIGALGLSQCCADVETMIRLDQVDDLDARVQALCDEVEIVLQAIREWTDAKA